MYRRFGLLRFWALQLLSEFLDLSPWAVSNSIILGILLCIVRLSYSNISEVKPHLGQNRFCPARGDLRVGLQVRYRLSVRFGQSLTPGVGQNARQREWHTRPALPTGLLRGTITLRIRPHCCGGAHYVCFLPEVSVN